MSGRSSRRGESLLLAGLVCACGSKGPPQADPTAAAALAGKLVTNAPNVGGVRMCKPEDLGPGGLTLTHLSALRLAKKPFTDDPEHKDWINPPELESPAIRTLLDPAAAPDALRLAAGAMTTAPYLLVYRVDNVDAPMALEIKEPKRSTIGTRAIRYEPTGKATCVQLVFFQSTKKVSDWAIDKSDMALIDPAVAKVLRDDLTEVYKATAPRPAIAATP